MGQCSSNIWSSNKEKSKPSSPNNLHSCSKIVMYQHKLVKINVAYNSEFFAALWRKAEIFYQYFHANSACHYYWVQFYSKWPVFLLLPSILLLHKSWCETRITSFMLVTCFTPVVSTSRGSAARMFSFPYWKHRFQLIEWLLNTAVGSFDLVFEVLR